MPPSSRKRAAPPPEEESDEFEDEEDESSGTNTLPRQCLDATIKLFVTHTEPNYSLPWQMRRQSSSMSSGFVIAGRRILTNAHCVDNFAVVKVKKRGEVNGKARNERLDSRALRREPHLRHTVDAVGR